MKTTFDSWQEAKRRGLDYEAWQKEWQQHCKQAAAESQTRAYVKLGLRGGKGPAKPKPEAKPAPKAKVDDVKEPGLSRATGLANTQGFACPECWTVPKNVRNDGFTVARHLPGNPDAKRYRDTEFCDGQGKIAIAVMQVGWSPGSEPRQKMSAKKWKLGKGEKV